MTKLHRRHFLKTASGIGALAGGGTLLGQSMQRALACDADGVANKRFVLWVFGNGWEDQEWAHDYDLATMPLPQMLSPFEPYKDELLLVQGIGCPMTPGLHSNWSALLSQEWNPGIQDRQTGHFRRPGGITLDRFLGARLRGDRPIDSLTFAHPHWSLDAQRFPCVAADGEDALHPGEWDAVRAFNSLFGEVDLGAEQMAERQRRELRYRRMLEFSSGSTRALRERLRGREAMRVEQLEDSLNELAGRIQTDALAPCARPDVPAAFDLEANFKKVSGELLRSYADLSYHAFVSGLTNVAHISNGAVWSPHSRYPDVGDTVGAHNAAPNHDHDSVEVRRNIFEYEMSHVAAMWQRLKDTPEGDGSMADNTIMMVLNGGGRAHHFGHRDHGHGVVVLGNLRGRLQSGRTLHVDKDEHALADLYVPVAQALGVGIDSFGAAEVNRGILPGVLT